MANVIILEFLLAIKKSRITIITLFRILRKAASSSLAWPQTGVSHFVGTSSSLQFDILDCHACSGCDDVGSFVFGDSCPHHIPWPCLWIYNVYDMDPYTYCIYTHMIPLARGYLIVENLSCSSSGFPHSPTSRWRMMNIPKSPKPVNPHLAHP